MTIESKLEHTIDPSTYQYSVKRKIFKLTDLSREDLLQVVCEHMDLMEELDSVSQALSHKIAVWRD
jgi:hypothetical protein